MKRIRTTLLACALTLLSGAETSFGMGFHGGGGRGGGGGGRGGFSGGGGGGMRAPSGGNFGGGGGMRAPSGGNFGGGNRGGSNFGGSNFGGAGGFSGGGSGGNMNSSRLQNHSFDSGARGGNTGIDRGNFSGGSIPGFGSGGRSQPGNISGDRAPGNRGPASPGDRGGAGQNNRLSDSELQNFLGLDSRPDAGNAGTRTGNIGDRTNNVSDRTNNLGDRTNNVRNRSGNEYNFNRADRINSGNVANRTDNNIRGNWADNHPEAADRINDWGNQVRDNWNDHGHGPWGGSDWWHDYHPGAGGWYYHYGWYNHPWDYWWRGATWGAVGGYLVGAAYSEPVYYSYGTGGNVVYQDNSVYVNGEDMGTQEEYYNSATELATVPPDQIPQPSDDQNASDDWLPLGTFSLSTSPDDTKPVRTLQLAVNKEGVVSGTMYNSSTKQSWPVQGRVDKKTQRVAFTIGDQKGVVLETGIYNLTQPQTEVLVHYGDNQTQTDLLVRLDPPQGGSSSGSSSDSGPLPSIQPN